MKNQKGKFLKGGSDLLKYSSLGLEMGVAIAVGLLIGMYLDKKFQTHPWLTILGFLLGIAAGFNNIIKLIIKESKESESAENDDSP